jgi:hypothetical protein
VVLLAPAGALAQVQRLRFAGRTGVTGQEPGQGQLFFASPATTAPA